MERYSKDLHISPELVATALESLRIHAVGKLAAKKKVHHLWIGHHQSYFDWIPTLHKQTHIRGGLELDCQRAQRKVSPVFQQKEYSCICMHQDQGIRNILFQLFTPTLPIMGKGL